VTTSLTNKKDQKEVNPTLLNFEKLYKTETMARSVKYGAKRWSAYFFYQLKIAAL
jgi:hypothetical protein